MGEGGSAGGAGGVGGGAGTDPLKLERAPEPDNRNRCEERVNGERKGGGKGGAEGIPKENTRRGAIHRALLTATSAS